MLVGGPVDESMNMNGATFYKPTVIINVTKDMKPFHEETFGPISPLCRFYDDEEAILIANDTE